MGRYHEVVGATNDLLLEIVIESWPLTKYRQAIDRDALGDHFVAGNGNKIASVVAAIGGNIITRRSVRNGAASRTRAA